MPYRTYSRDSRRATILMFSLIILRFVIRPTFYPLISGLTQDEERRMNSLGHRVYTGEVSVGLTIEFVVRKKREENKNSTIHTLGLRPDQRRNTDETESVLSEDQASYQKLL